jgi:hypothetical protein
MFQVLKLPFDCQAIFLSPHADFRDPAASLINAPGICSCCRFVCGLISAAARQHRPGDARQLVGQRHDDDVLVCPRQQSARPPPKWRLALDQVRQHGSRAVDQVLAKIAIAALADAEQARLARRSSSGVASVRATPPCPVHA